MGDEAGAFAVRRLNERLVGPDLDSVSDLPHLQNEPQLDRLVSSEADCRADEQLEAIGLYVNAGNARTVKASASLVVVSRANPMAAELMPTFALDKLVPDESSTSLESEPQL